MMLSVTSAGLYPVYVRLNIGPSEMIEVDTI